MGSAYDATGNFLGETTANTAREVLEDLQKAHPNASEFRIHEIPRRARLDLLTPAERAIYDAIQVVDAAGADVRLTDAVVLLQAARDSVADYVDGVHKRRVVSEEKVDAPEAETLADA